MAKFQSSIDFVDNGNGTYNLNYNIFLPGRNYSEAEVNITQINEYNSGSQSMPGVRVEIKFEDGGLGNPLTLSGSISIAAPYVVDGSKPFVEAVYKAWDTAAQMYKDKGGAIVRGHIPS